MFNTLSNNKIAKGFTVIELLVVIAIIGLLSSVVLVSMKGSTGKARIAKSLEFSQTILNAIGVDAVGIWSFDEGSGPTVFDKSGYGNHGTLVGNTHFVSGEENTPHWFVNEGEGRSALKFDGSGDYVNCGTSGFNNSEGTIEMWIKPNFNGASSFPSHIYFFGSPGTYKSFRIWSGNGYLYWTEGWTYCTESRNWVSGKWYHIIGTWKYPLDKDHQSGVELYVNGKECGRIQNNSTYSFTATSRIGENFDGVIDEVRIYGQALSLSEIQQHYAAGAQKHQLVIND